MTRNEEVIGSKLIIIIQFNFVNCAASVSSLSSLDKTFNDPFIKVLRVVTARGKYTVAFMCSCNILLAGRRCLIYPVLVSKCLFLQLDVMSGSLLYRRIRPCRLRRWHFQPLLIISLPLYHYYNSFLSTQFCRFIYISLVYQFSVKSLNSVINTYLNRHLSLKVKVLTILLQFLSHWCIYSDVSCMS